MNERQENSSETTKRYQGRATKGKKIDALATVP